MLLLIDIGNTHTHVGLANGAKIGTQLLANTSGWRDGATQREIEEFLAGAKVEGACFCSVVPKVSPFCVEYLKGKASKFLELNSSTIRGVGIDYPKPETIGADRLANAMAVK